jgi:hypothetical protein
MTLHGWSWTVCACVCAYVRVCVTACAYAVCLIVGAHSYNDITPNSDDALIASLNTQPTSIAIEADQNSFQFYSSGVLTATCGTNIDHAVLAVGYGKLGSDCYYKVKNSWGSSWGMSGYILLGRGPQYGAEGQCGILSGPSAPVA